MKIRHPMGLRHPVHSLLGSRVEREACMTDSTDNATLPKSTKSRNSNSVVQIQMNSKSQFEFEPRETKECEFLDSVDFGDAWGGFG